jgi:hypothetical protein
VYATCLFCNQHLGSNDVVETFPVGRRLAFDAARGRLWVVCRHCERWNQLLKDYEAPPLDEAKDEELQAYIAQRKAEIPDAWY